jgi:hypothetical protein
MPINSLVNSAAPSSALSEVACMHEKTSLLSADSFVSVERVLVLLLHTLQAVSSYMPNLRLAQLLPMGISLNLCRVCGSYHLLLTA